MTIENDIRIDQTSQVASKIENHDWAQLAFYKDENKKLSTIEEKNKRVVFVGDSITEGWSNLFPTFFSDSRFINRGISGQTTPQMLVRFRPDAIDLKPYLIIILAGTNDIAGNTGPSTEKMITDNIFSMAELAIGKGIKVALSSILPVYEYSWNTSVIKPYETIDLINAKIKFYAEENGLDYVNYFKSMVDERRGLKDTLTSDGVHPNQDGYRVMSEVVTKSINKIIS